MAAARRDEVAAARRDGSGAARRDGSGAARRDGSGAARRDGGGAAGAGGGVPVAGGGERDRRRVRIVPGGPVLVEGPVEVVLPDGRTVVSDRFLVALCACRRSRSYPFCDTSHRRRVRAGDPATADAPHDPGGAGRAGPDVERPGTGDGEDHDGGDRVEDGGEGR